MFLGTLFRWLTRGTRLKQLRERTARLRKEVEQLEAVAVPFRRMNETVEAYQLRLTRASMNRDELEAKRDELETLLALEKELQQTRWPWSRPTLRPRREVRPQPAPLVTDAPVRREVPPWYDQTPTVPAPEESATPVSAEEPIEAAESLSQPVGEPEIAADPAEPLEAGLPVAGQQQGSLTMEWLGGTCYRFLSPRGRVVLTNPWATSADFPEALGEPPKTDIVLVAGGGADEANHVALVALETGARVVRPRFGSSRWPEADFEEDKLTQDVRPGDQLTIQGITVCIVGTGNLANLAAAPDAVPVGFVVIFENGWVVYFAVDMAKPDAQALVAQMYRPDMAILPLPSGADPDDFATQVQALMAGSPHLSTVFTHQGATGPATDDDTVVAAQAAIDALKLDMEITSSTLGRTYALPAPELGTPPRPVRPRSRPPIHKEQPVPVVDLQPVAPPVEAAPSPTTPPTMAPVDVVLPEALDTEIEPAVVEPEPQTEETATPPAEVEAATDPEVEPLAGLDQEAAEEVDEPAIELPGRETEDLVLSTLPVLRELRIEVADADFLAVGVAAEERNHIGAMTIQAVTEESLGVAVALASEADSALLVSLVSLSVVDEETAAGPVFGVFREGEQADRRLLALLKTEADESLRVPMEEAELPLEEAELPEIPEPAPEPEPPLPAPPEPVIAETVAAEPTVRPPRLDMAGVLPFVQKRRLHQYQELRTQTAHLEAEVTRLGELYGEWLRQAEDPELGAVAQATRRLREATTREELDTKRQQLADLKARTAYMEARYPVLPRLAAEREERPEH